jgi:hypothetical protein
LTKSNFSANISGLEDLKASLDGKKLSKDVALGLGQAMLSLHSALSFEVAKRYNVRSSGKPVLDSILIGKTKSTIAFGQKSVEASLTYKYIPRDLSKFPYTWEWGNINPGARRKGQVHSVAVKRNQSKIVYGLNHLGGFVPKYRDGSVKRFEKYGAQMFERDGPDKYPIHLLFGPSLSDMTEYVFDSRLGKVGEALDNIESFISEQILF